MHVVTKTSQSTPYCEVDSKSLDKMTKQLADGPGESNLNIEL